ncbi:MAG TPA: penicillin acylase family protein, partial [Acidimicrobiales bacterium]|nr:penicillin acylase family protein [Acidimicrobiales bacterium]
MAGARRSAAVVLSVASCALALVGCSGSASSASGGGRGAAMHDRDVLPPGEGGSVPPGPHSTDQIPLYDGLTPLASSVSATDVQRYFKDDPLGSTVGRAESVPRAGLRLLRDSYDVPHIFGKTRADAEFGAGWVAAEDRGLILEVIRGAGRIAALDVPGIDAFSTATNLQSFAPTAQTEQFLSNELNLADTLGREGRQVRSDAQNYVDGINAYYRAT